MVIYHLGWVPYVLVLVTPVLDVLGPGTILPYHLLWVLLQSCHIIPMFHQLQEVLLYIDVVAFPIPLEMVSAVCMPHVFAVPGMACYLA